MVDVNLMGPIHIIESFVPQMVARGKGGQLVNVSSAAVLLALPWHAAYSASKFGLRGVSEVLRFDLRRHRIGVSLVCPGAVATPLVNTVDIVGIDRDNAEVAALLKLGSGRISDRWKRRKPLIALGYGISALARPFYALAMIPLHAVLIRAGDRVGKGLRGPARDAMVADAVPAADRGNAFGFHPGMTT